MFRRLAGVIVIGVGLAGLAGLAGCKSDSGSGPGSDLGGPQDDVPGAEEPPAPPEPEDPPPAEPDPDPAPEPTPEPSPACETLPAPAGAVVRAGPQDADRLRSIVMGAATGTTILLEDGTYALDGGDASHRLHFGTPGVTLRSASGDPHKVVLDGGWVTAEIIYIDASNVTIADVTVTKAYNHLVHVVAGGSSHTTGTRVHDCRLIDPGQQAVKINNDPNRPYFADDGEVSCTRIELTAEGRPHVRGCYTGGIDAHRAKGWRVRGNTIAGFWCAAGLSEHGVHFWTGSRDTVVEANTIVNCARGIGFGLGSSTPGRTYPDAGCPGAEAGAQAMGHYGGIIRNNVVVADDPALFASAAGFDAGISLEKACGTQVLHNTVASSEAPFASIEYRFAGTSVTVLNNLMTHALRARDGAAAVLGGNVEGAPLEVFADAAARDLHLAPDAVQAIDRGVAVAEGLCDQDVDGEPRGTARDVGADEAR
ncbi:MAG: right-handed parallel beta-helix repeat-containing protein [Planctomycetes bacterium]|nr:right-handed parallel beta-helix repeat-containing protein [Planctomycetota bacterium]